MPMELAFCLGTVDLMQAILKSLLLTVLVTPYVFEQRSLGMQRCGIPLCNMLSLSKEAGEFIRGYKQRQLVLQRTWNITALRMDLRETCKSCP